VTDPHALATPDTDLTRALRDLDDAERQVDARIARLTGRDIRPLESRQARPGSDRAVRWRSTR
jgi:hypothetical protein